MTGVYLDTSAADNRDGVSCLKPWTLERCIVASPCCWGHDAVQGGWVVLADLGRSGFAT